ncbi:MAG: glycosyltransferase family 2 protein [Actinomycetota bacterium]
MTTVRDPAPGPTSIAVYVCTHRRNEPLRRMLASLDVAARRVQPEIEIAVVVVDDNPDGRARAVVDEADVQFRRGLHYRHSGAQNISIARNTGLDAAMALGDWVAMTDDDQIVVPEWFVALADVQRRTGADAVTGPVHLQYEPSAASWLREQPFAEILEAPRHPDGSRVEVCSTGNSMIRSAFLSARPELRFRPDLGVIGGEDMVFYRAAVAAGLDARFATEAVCYGVQPPERESFRYQLQSCFWLGNTECITNLESASASRIRLAARALRRLGAALRRPVVRIMGRQAPEVRFALALAAQSSGLLVGVAGVRVAHP